MQTLKRFFAPQLFGHFQCSGTIGNMASNGHRGLPLEPGRKPASRNSQSEQIGARHQGRRFILPGGAVIGMAESTCCESDESSAACCRMELD